VRIGSEILYRQPTRSVIACLCEGASADWNPVATYADFFSAIAAVAGAGFFIAAASWDGAVLLVRSTDPARSPTWYLAEKNPLSCSDIGLDCPSLQRIEIAPMELFSFPAHDGTYIYGYLTRSFSPSENGFILLLHGGPHDRDHYTFRRDHQFFSHLGFNVASINFRGSTGFGPIFRSLGYRSWGGEMQSDVYSAADWGLREGLAPNGKLFIVGASYGGYSALLAANQSDTPFAAVAAINPVVDLVALIREAPTHWASYRSLIIDRIGDPDDPLDTIRLIKNSPISSVHTIVSRVLLVVGSNDGRLNAKRTFEYFINARATGAAIEMVNYTDQGHVLRTLSIQAEILTKIAHFFLEPDLSSE
ncbi:MAG: alpha/beta hydrolase family protein, partial [Gloeotrichia echinulata HAB0833]